MKLPIALLAVLLFSSIGTLLWASEGTDGVRTELKADDLVIVQAGELKTLGQRSNAHGRIGSTELQRISLKIHRTVILL